MAKTACLGASERAGGTRHGSPPVGVASCKYDLIEHLFLSVVRARLAWLIGRLIGENRLRVAIAAEDSVRRGRGSPSTLLRVFCPVLLTIGRRNRHNVCTCVP